MADEKIHESIATLSAQMEMLTPTIERIDKNTENISLRVSCLETWKGTCMGGLRVILTIIPIAVTVILAILFSK